MEAAGPAELASISMVWDPAPAPPLSLDKQNNFDIIGCRT